MDKFLGRRHCSVHEVGLVDLLNMARLTGNDPAHRALIAIQPDSLDWGDGPSVAITRVLPSTTDMALKLRARWIGSLHRHQPTGTANSVPGVAGER